MSQPPDKIIFDLVPNEDGDDPRITRAVEAAIRRLAKQHGLKVTEPGAIDPAAKKNPDRAEKIKNETTPKLIEYTYTEKGVERAEERRPDGRLHRRVERIGERTRKLSVDFAVLANLGRAAIDFFNESKDSLIELATKVGRYVGDLVGSRRGKESNSTVEKNDESIAARQHEQVDSDHEPPPASPSDPPIGSLYLKGSDMPPPTE